MVAEELDHDEDASGFERRTFLRSTGVAGLGAVAATGASPAAAAPTGTSLGTVHLVEVGVEHVDTPDLPANEVDPLSFSTVDLKAGRFTLGVARQSDVETFGRGTPVVIDGGYRPLPATAFDGRPGTELTVETNDRLRPMATLPTASPYRRPRVRVTSGAGGTVTATVDGQSVDVEPRGRNTLRADTREVTLVEPRDAASSGTGDDGPPTRTASVTPVVTVQNYGTLETYVRAVRNGGGPR